MGRFGEKPGEVTLRWFGHVRRKDDGNIERRMLRTELPGTRKREGLKRCMDAVREGTAVVEAPEEDAEDGTKINGDGKSAVPTRDGRS